MGTGKFDAGHNPATDWHLIQGRGGGGVEIRVLIVTSCYRNWDKLRPYGPLGSNADFTLPIICLNFIGKFQIQYASQWSVVHVILSAMEFCYYNLT